MRAFHFFILALIGSSAAFAAPMFSVTPLPEQPSGLNDNNGRALNDYGQGVGIGFTEFGVRGYLWTPTTPNGNTGVTVTTGSTTQATGINSLGQVTGLQVATGGTVAFVFSPSTPNGTTGTRTPLGMLPGGTNSNGQAINGQGQIVGSGNVTGSAAHPFLWTPSSPNGSAGAMVDLGLLPGTTSGAASSINEYGQVIGNTGADTRAFLWTPATPNGQAGAMVEIAGFPAGTTSVSASGINASGKIIGGRNFSSYLWTPTVPNGSTGTAILLGVLPGQDRSVALGINDAGSVVGFNDRTGQHTASLWTAADGMMDLNKRLDASGAGWILREARDINNKGQIIGVGSYNGVGSQTFLLTPIPEPAALGVFSIAVIALHRRCRLNQA